MASYSMARKPTAWFFNPGSGDHLSRWPVLCLNNTEIKIVNEIKYLGFVLDSYLRDDFDIKRQTRAVYCIANKLRSNFYLCSKHVKNVLYRSYCMPMCGCQLWCDFYSYNYNRIKVAYNNAYRILHNISRSSISRNITFLDPVLHAYVRMSIMV